MNKIKLALVIAAMCAPAWSQTGVSASLSMDGQPTVRLESKLEPEQPSLARAFETGTASRNKRFQRYLYDKESHEYFGYSLALDRVNSHEYRITLGSLVLNPAEHPISDPSARLMPSPVFPPPQIVHFGDKVAIDFFENAKTGQKIVDYLWLERQNCDGETEKADCLAKLLANADGEPERGPQIETLVLQALRQSQQSWESYRDDACRSLPDRVKQLECKLKLTRSRVHELRMVY